MCHSACMPWCTGKGTFTCIRVLFLNTLKEAFPNLSYLLGDGLNLLLALFFLWPTRCHCRRSSFLHLQEGLVVLPSSSHITLAILFSVDFLLWRPWGGWLPWVYYISNWSWVPWLPLTLRRADIKSQMPLPSVIFGPRYQKSLSTCLLACLLEKSSGARCQPDMVFCKNYWQRFSCVLVRSEKSKETKAVMTDSFRSLVYLSNLG